MTPTERVWVAGAVVAIVWPWCTARAPGEAVIRLLGAAEQTRHDVAPGEEVVWQWEVLATSAGETVVTAVSSSCGCLGVAVDPSVLTAGGRAVVTLRTRPPAFGAFHGWTVLRAASAAGATDLTLEVRCTVGDDTRVRVAPSVVRVRGGQSRARVDVVVTGTGPGARDLTRAIKSIRLAGDDLRMRISQVKDVRERAPDLGGGAVATVEMALVGSHREPVRCVLEVPGIGRSAPFTVLWSE